jgi:glycosyltransferase involved in cell wall biosynthesis
MPAKVCHFSSVHQVWDTRVFHRECVSLAKIFDVTLIAIGEGNQIKQGVQVIGIPKPKNFWYRYLFTIWKVFILAVKVDAQIYHIHDAEMVPFGIVLSILGKKVIYDIHENTHGDILLKPWLPKPIRKILASLYNLVLRIASRFMHFIVVVADPKFLTSFFVKEEECTIIQNFADTSEMGEFRVIDRHVLPGNHLFYVGMIRDMYYSIDPVLEAVALLKEKGIRVDLHLVGYFGSKTNTKLDTVACWERIHEQIHYYGFLETQEAYKVSMQCKIGICIKNQPEDMLVSHERKLFEYMAIGLPSIFCNRSIYTDLNTKTSIGLAINIESAEEISVAIAELLKKEENYAASQNNFTHSNEDYNWQKEEQKLLGLYRILLTTT